LLGHFRTVSRLYAKFTELVTLDVVGDVPFRIEYSFDNALARSVFTVGYDDDHLSDTLRSVLTKIFRGEGYGIEERGLLLCRSDQLYAGHRLLGGISRLHKHTFLADGKDGRTINRPHHVL